MKKLISSIILISFIFASLVGCSTPANNSDGKSEEELRAEIRAQLEAEKAAENDALIDRDALYEFVKQEIVNITKEHFNTWEVYYFDITENGMEEAILVHPYGVDWYDKVEIITFADGKYQRISSDINSGKYGTSIDFRDGFLVVETEFGGSGEHFTYMDLFKYDSPRMINVLSDITISHSVAFPTADFEATGKIEGRLTDFTYTLTKYDNRTNKETIEDKTRYVYNASNRGFDIKPMEIPASSQNQVSTPQPSQNQGSTGQTSQPAAGQLLEMYEFGKTYKYDLRGNGTLESFSIVDDMDNYEMYLLVEGTRFDLEYIHPINSNNYKIIKHLDEGFCVFVISSHNMPWDESQFNFHMYLPGYDVEQIGSFVSSFELEDLDVKYVQYPATVRIGDQTYELTPPFRY